MTICVINGIFNYNVMEYLPIFLVNYITSLSLPVILALVFRSKLQLFFSEIGEIWSGVKWTLLVTTFCLLQVVTNCLWTPSRSVLFPVLCHAVYSRQRYRISVRPYTAYANWLQTLLRTCNRHFRVLNQKKTFANFLVHDINNGIQH